MADSQSRPETTLPNPNIYLKSGTPVDRTLSPVPARRYDPELSNFIYGTDSYSLFNNDLFCAITTALGWLVIGMAIGHWVWP